MVVITTIPEFQAKQNGYNPGDKEIALRFNEHKF